MNKNDWTRGYFCAIAKVIEAEDRVAADVESLFRAGGNWRLADPLDIEVFVEHGLVPFPPAPSNNGFQRTGRAARCESSGVTARR